MEASTLRLNISENNLGARGAIALARTLVVSPYLYSLNISQNKLRGKGLAEVIQAAEARGATGAEVDRVEKEWLEAHPLCTFNEGKGCCQSKTEVNLIDVYLPHARKSVAVKPAKRLCRSLCP